MAGYYSKDVCFPFSRCMRLVTFPVMLCWTVCQLLISTDTTVGWYPLECYSCNDMFQNDTNCVEWGEYIYILILRRRVQELFYRGTVVLTS